MHGTASAHRPAARIPGRSGAWGRLRMATACALGMASVCLPSLAAAGSLAAGAGKYTVHDTVVHSYVTVYYYKPRHYTPDTPVVFVLHGLRRNARDYRDSWEKVAEKDNLLILTPKFSRTVFRGANGYNLGNIFHAITHDEAIGRRKPARMNPRPLWAGSLVERLFSDFRSHRETTDWKTYFLYGHGAGGQFVDHMMMFMPDTHVELAIAASAGWYTIPNPAVRWPYGIKDIPALNEATLKAFYQAPLVLLMGSKDTRTHNTVMRQNEYTARQGDNRLARAHYDYDYGREQAQKLGVPFHWRLQVAPGVGHRVEDMVPYAAQVIAGDVRSHADAGASITGSR